MTRLDEESDFATDTCVSRKGVDPETGTRYLEEIAFEVVSEQNEGYVSEKARRMHRRGVRRIFTVWIKNQRVCEWSPEIQSWRRLEPDSWIEDSCLATPLSVAALLDAALADDAVVRALAAKGNPELQRREAVAEARGIAKSVLAVLDARAITVTPAQREEILNCQDAARLNRRLRRATVAASADEVTSEP